ncbi:MAG: DUF47 domain-containing protein [Spirochaetes bacterium]|nr:DUF47 domain-containing protein [Spirochaetota bacterium]
MPFSFSFIPKEIKFFELFDKQAEKLIATTRCFREFVADGSLDADILQILRDLEHEADEITHDIIDKLNRTFITPFDREDIHTLAHEMDNIVDILYTTAKRMKVYKCSKANPELIEFSGIIEKSVQNLAEAIGLLRDHKRNNHKIVNCCIEINRLENVGDQLRDAAVSKLFEKTKNPVSVLKWKEIYESAETCLDICEDVANVISTILVKQG